MPCIEAKIRGTTDPSQFYLPEKLLLDFNPMILEELF
jgi:hypothetical protein